MKGFLSCWLLRMNWTSPATASQFLRRTHCAFFITSELPFSKLSGQVFMNRRRKGQSIALPNSLGNSKTRRKNIAQIVRKITEPARLVPSSRLSSFAGKNDRPKLPTLVGQDRMPLWPLPINGPEPLTVLRPVRQRRPGTLWETRVPRHWSAKPCPGPDYVLVHTTSIRLANGRLLLAANYGLRCFTIWVKRRSV